MIHTLGAKIRKLKVDFLTDGTWRRAMNTDSKYLCFFFIDLVVLSQTPTYKKKSSILAIFVYTQAFCV